MKMIDILGRSLSIDIVYKTRSRIETGKWLWTRPLEFNLVHSGTTYAAVPYGAVALRVMSQLGAEITVYQEGKLLIATALKKGEHYVERDSEGNLLAFKVPDDLNASVSSQNTPLGSESLRQLALPESCTAGGDEFDPQLPKLIPNQPGLLFVVARLAEDPEIVGNQPPRIEYELEFQMNTPEQHHRTLAANLRNMVVPAMPPDRTDVLSLTPSKQPTTTFICSCTTCKSSR